MPHHLTVRINNSTHPFLADTTVLVTDARDASRSLATSAHHGMSGPGEWSFEVAEGVSEVEIDVSVLHQWRSPSASSTAERDQSRSWVFRQKYRVEAACLVPVEPERADHDDIWTPKPIEPRAVRRSAGSAHHLDVDLSFLDVTDIVLANDARLREEYAGCAVKLYQYTGLDAGSHATVVGVVVPAAMRAARDRADTLTFFCPAQSAYRDATDVLVGQFTRYVDAPADADRWGFFTLHQGRLRYTAWPQCRFAQQLTDSRRAVILVIPFANDASYGPWHSSLLTLSSQGGARPSLLTSLLRALQGDRVIGREQPTTRKIAQGRAGVGGFSLGGAHGLRAFDENRTRVGELYLFDPNDFGTRSPYRAKVKEWVRTPGRRLRIVGGMHLPELLEYARSDLGASIEGASDARPDPLSADPSVMILPTSASFWHRSRDYAEAYRAEPTPWLTVAGATPEGSVSAITGVRLAASVPEPGHDLPLRVELEDGRQVTATAPEFSAVELGVGLYLEELRREQYAEADGVFRATREGTPEHEDAARERRLLLTGFPVWRSPRAASEEDLRTRIDHLRRVPRGMTYLPLPAALRHQWVVFGGQSAPGPRAFKGYLQICLETSGFAR